MTNVIQAILSSISMTIPEFAFMVIITFKLLKRHDMLDFYNLKSNIKQISIIVIPPAILYNLFGYIIKISSGLNHLISLVILYCLLIYILEKNSFITYPNLKKKSLLFLGIALLFPIAIEMITLPIILKVMNMSYEAIKSNFYLTILCSFAPRIIEIFILVFVLTWKNKKFQINFLSYIFNNKFFTRMTICLTVSLIIFETYFMHKLLSTSILTNDFGTVYEQLGVVITATFLIPCLLILGLYSYVNYCIEIACGEKQIID